MIEEAKEFRDWADIQRIKADRYYQGCSYDEADRKERQKYLMKRHTYDRLIDLLGQIEDLSWEEQLSKIRDFADFKPVVLEGNEEALNEIKDKLKE